MTGLRQMELLGLTWADVRPRCVEVQVLYQLSRSPGQGRVALKTTKAKRDVAIPPALAHELRKHRASTIFKAPEDYVFATDSGEPLGWSNVDPYALGSAVKAAKLRAPLPRFHDLRHSFASAAIAQGQDVVYVSRQLGHAGTDITLRVYAGEFAKAQHAEKHREAMEATFGAILSGNIVETRPVRTSRNEPPRRSPQFGRAE
jgi:integrase